MTTPPDTDLPLHVIRQDSASPQVTRRRFRFHKRYLLVFLIPVFMFSGGVIGMYYQPTALQKFYALTGLQPGGGATKPIALPPNMEMPKEMAATMQVSDVVGLARLMPRGDVSIVAPPFGAGDARIAEVLVSIGDRVEKGAVVARLDNRGQLEGAVLQAEANVAVREAALVQTTESVKNSQAEALAALEQARSSSTEAAAEYERSKALFDRGVITQASLDSLAAAERQAGLAVQKAEATLSRFASQEAELQPDVIVAARNLDAAKADLARAEQDLIRSAVLSPISGVVLDSMANPGERPPSDGIMQIGDTDQMMAEVEVYQDRIANVAVGQPVELAAVAIGQTLQGRVKSIGLTVGRQGLLSDDTAANTDARVIKVMVELDAASSRVAARYTNLEVIARIDTRTLAPAAKSNP
ncbi:HlyD family efflux transporter periplasmic adaptor subunit [Hoeflea sp.]|uniref:HlyD family efflux transporter periplasmic adaptor subunit n=1 Tax=Hoeflea sp. TaxID=1940281 RepID=UPI0019C9D742|nr:HlyD family efflux transporter periplasmic adaptor subunit [Hoeflea sp.]MBC7283447.1 HlyD family efflux transporter periplasmic adaptor subunit [Hoeflea sp.]